MSNREDTVKELIRQQILKAAPDLIGYKVVLFGSRAAGKARERSDFDIGILGSQPISPQAFYKIEDLLERIETLYRIDLVDLNRVSPSFRTQALTAVEVLYG